MGIIENRKIFNFALILADYGKIKNLTLADSKSFLNFTSTNVILTIPKHSIKKRNKFGDFTNFWCFCLKLVK